MWSSVHFGTWTLDTAQGFGLTFRSGGGTLEKSLIASDHRKT